MRRIWTLYLKRTIAILPSADWSIYHQSTHGLLHNHTCTLSRTPAHCHSHICPLMTFGQKERRSTAHLQLDLVLDSGRGWLMNRTCKLIFWCFLHSRFSLVRVVCTNCLCPAYVCVRGCICVLGPGIFRYSHSDTRSAMAGICKPLNCFISPSLTGSSLLLCFPFFTFPPFTLQISPW